MLERISEKDIDFCECLYDPLCLAESLFTNYDNLSMFELGKFGHVRMGQIPLLSYEYSIGDNPNLSDKQNFAQKIGAGDCYVMGARNWGKTLFASKIDVLQSLMLNDGYPMGFCSYDAVHIRGVLDPVIDALEYHPIISMYKKTIKRSPSYTIITKNNALLEGINMNIMSANPGHQFFQKHMKKLWVEESSFLSEEVDKKRTESRHEIGCIQRLSGMTNFTKHSPTGKIFYDLTKIPWMFNLPQYINPKWDKAEKEKAIKKYSGEQSLGYRIFVKGEVVEDGISVMDMGRIRPFYVEGRVFKNFEVSKKIFNNFRDAIVIERPKNADQMFVCADIGGEGGSSSPTEIVILSKVNDKYKFLYNISLFALTDREQDKVFDYIIEKVRPNFISLDTTDGTGRSIYRYLENLYGKDNLIWCFHPETDILTEQGWKRFYDLKKSDKVATLNPDNNKMFYTSIVSYYERDYDGDMVTYDAERLKFSVTPEHSLYLRPHTMTNKFKFLLAKDLNGYESIKRDLGIYKGKKIDYITIKIDGFDEKKFKIIPFLKFLGWYLSEGCASFSLITIYQSLVANSSKHKEIVEVCKELGFSPYVYKNSVKIHSKLLVNWLKKECYNEGIIKYKTIYNCYNKKIPIFIKQLDKSLLNYIIDTLWKGDGWVSCVGQRGYKTSSKQLADDVQEIVLKTGLVSTVTKNKPKERYNRSLGRIVKGKGCYKILICKNKNSTIRKFELKKEKFKGKVYDVEVKPYHLIYVRYKGKSFWSGNCSFNEKIAVDFDKDDYGNVIMNDGKPTYKEEYVSEWSVKHLRDLLYDGKIEIPADCYKLDIQLNSIKAMQSGTRTIYQPTVENDHLFQAMQTFAIAHWMNEFNLLKPISIKKFAKFGV